MPDLPLHLIRYRWKGDPFWTVVQAEDAATAEAQFRSLNPHVEFVSCGSPGDPDPEAPPMTCGHGPLSCPHASFHGTCQARRCPYGLRAADAQFAVRSCP